MDLGPLGERDQNGNLIEVTGDDIAKATFDLREGLLKRADIIKEPFDPNNIKHTAYVEPLRRRKCPGCHRDILVDDDGDFSEHFCVPPEPTKMEKIMHLVLSIIDWLNGLTGAEKPKTKTNGEKMATLAELFEGDGRGDNHAIQP